MGEILLALFEPRRFEHDGRVYDWLGVGLFRRILPFGPWFNRAVRAFIGRPRARVIKDEKTAQTWVVFTMVAEVCHAVALLVFLGLTVAAVVGQDPIRAAWILLGNVVVNLYPIMVQRYVRTHLLSRYRLDLRQVSRWDLQ